MSTDIQQTLSDTLTRLRVRAWRIGLDPVDVDVTLPMLRGIWGASLHDVHRPLYHVLFEGHPTGTPGFLLRPAPESSAEGVTFEFVLFGTVTAEILERVWAAWDQAAQRGLGPHRRVTALRRVEPLAADGSTRSAGREHLGFPLAPLTWPMPLEKPCKLALTTPMRLLREKRLITQPTLPDLTVAAIRRLSAQAPEDGQAVWHQRHDWLKLARQVRAELFRGGPRDLVRYSARQQAEVELRGVSGELLLPEGPGALAGLLLAATWLNLGKSTVQGMGQLQIVRGET